MRNLVEQKPRMESLTPPTAKRRVYEKPAVTTMTVREVVAALGSPQAATSGVNYQPDIYRPTPSRGNGSLSK